MAIISKTINNTNSVLVSACPNLPPSPCTTGLLGTIPPGTFRYFNNTGVDIRFFDTGGNCGTPVSCTQLVDIVNGGFYDFTSPFLPSQIIITTNLSDCTNYLGAGCNFTYSGEGCFCINGTACYINPVNMGQCFELGDANSSKAYINLTGVTGCIPPGPPNNCTDPPFNTIAFGTARVENQSLVSVNVYVVDIPCVPTGACSLYATLAPGGFTDVFAPPGCSIFVSDVTITSCNQIYGIPTSVTGFQYQCSPFASTTFSGNFFPVVAGTKYYYIVNSVSTGNFGNCVFPCAPSSAIPDGAFRMCNNSPSPITFTGGLMNGFTLNPGQSTSIFLNLSGAITYFTTAGLHSIHVWEFLGGVYNSDFTGNVTGFVDLAADTKGYCVSITT